MDFKSSKLRHFSISTYSFGLVILALIPLIVVAYLTAVQSNDIQDKAKSEDLRLAKEELKEVVALMSSDIRSSAVELASWDETLAQLLDATYYQFWKELRLKETYRIQSLMAEVDLYNTKGESLNQGVTPKKVIEPLASIEPVIWNDNGQIFLVYYFPVPQGKFDGSEGSDGEFLGYVGLKSDIGKLLKQRYKLRYSNASAIDWNLSPGSFGFSEVVADSTSLSVRNSTAIVEFSHLVRDSALKFIAYMLALFFVVGMLWLFLFSRPLVRLAGHIKNLYEGTADSIPESLHSIAKVAELEHVREAINDYVSRFTVATQSLVEKNQELTHLTYRDTLTGTFNRRAFEQHLMGAMESARSENAHHVLCYLDLDQFKIVNDTCGHIAGDALLKQIAYRLQHEIRDSDMLARIGGDEFGVILQGCDLHKARQIANAMRSSVQQHRFAWDDKLFEIGVSIGVVPIVKDSLGSDELLGAADSACYVAKDLGRNRVHVYQANDLEVKKRSGEMQWVSRINLALDENRFCLYLQPIVSTNGHNAPTHFEVLLRMRGSAGELVPPMAFLPAAERYQLMPKIDRWVVSETVNAIVEGRFPYAGKSPLFAINLSGQTLGDEGFLEFTSSLIRKTKVNPRCLCFEITETAAITNLYAANRFISTFQELGCRFALDDFGSGLSSFGYLKSLPVDYLKIDGNFIRHLLDDPINRTIVESIHHIGHSIGLKTVAEYVENDQLLKILRSIGIDYVQGFAIAEPSPLSDKPILTATAG